MAWTCLNLIQKLKIYFQQVAEIEGAIDQVGWKSWLERNVKSHYLVNKISPGILSTILQTAFSI